MTPRNPLPSAATRLHPKRGSHDCAVAAIASLIRRDYEEVLMAAARVAPQFWSEGLTAAQHVSICRRLGVKTTWLRAFDLEEDRGVLWVEYHDTAAKHSIYLDAGKVYDSDHNPVTMWDVDDYLRHACGFPVMLLTVKGE